MATGERKWDVMISYEWNSGKKFVKMLLPMLKEAYLNTWVDEEQMHGDLLDRMAEGISQSDVILLFISEGYKNSSNCSREYQHAHKMKKKIIPVKVEAYDPPDDSSLGILISGKLYYTLYKNFDENAKKIIKAIKKIQDEVHKEKDASTSEKHPKITSIDDEGLIKSMSSLIASSDATYNINVYGPTQIGDAGQMTVISSPAQKEETTTKNDDTNSEKDNLCTHGHLIPISVGHNENMCARIKRGQNSRSLQCVDSYLFYAYDVQIQGTVPFSIGEAGEGDRWRHIVVEGTDAGSGGWTHVFTFYAYKNDWPGTVPYSVAHADNEGGGWKFQLLENVTSASSSDWIHEFSFYAFSVDPSILIPVSVGCNEDLKTAMVTVGVNVNAKQYRHVFTFDALQDHHHGSFPFAVYSQGHNDGKRYQVQEENDVDKSENGWVKDVSFYAFKDQKPGTRRFTFGHVKTQSGVKYCILDDLLFPSAQDYIQQGVFYAYHFDTSLLTKVAVVSEPEHGCVKLRQDNCIEDSRFKNYFTFYCYKVPFPGTIPISVGEAGADFNHTTRNCIYQGNDAGNRGWNHLFTVFVFPKERPGTIEISVCHADFALGGGGWKYRVFPHGAISGTQNWTHDFVFYGFSCND